MAINRISQITAETRSNSEWISTITSFVALGYPTVSSVKARTGTYSWLTGRSIGMALPDLDCFRSNFAFNHLGATGAILMTVHRTAEVNQAIFVDNDSGSNLITLFVDGVIRDTISTPTAGMDQTDTWLNVGLYVEAGTPGKVIVYVDGLEILRYDGNLVGNFDYMLGPGASPGGFIPSGWTSGYLDDWYVDELTEGDIAEGSPPSPGFMSTTVANETFVEWIPIGDSSNVLCVDDGVPDNDATYVNTETVGDIDRYHFNPITLPENYHIVAAIPYVVARKTDAESAIQLEILAYDGLNSIYSDIIQLPTGYRVRYGRLLTQPDATPWSEADFNAMHFGFRSAGSF